VIGGLTSSLALTLLVVPAALVALVQRRLQKTASGRRRAAANSDLQSCFMVGM
jgi:hypothetical protein